MRVLVCGGTKYNNTKLIYDTLDHLHESIGFTVIIEGEAQGVDITSRHWAESRGIEVEPYPADWNRYGKGAGHIRNKQMIDEGNPDLVIAFPGNRGTKNMKMQTRHNSISLIEVSEIDGQPHIEKVSGI